MGTNEKASPPKSFALTTTKRRSTGKLSQLGGRAGRNSHVSLAQKAGRNIISNSSQSGQKNIELRITPAIGAAADLPPSIPRRRSSLIGSSRTNEYNETSDGQGGGQHNAVFGQVSDRSNDSTGQHNAVFGQNGSVTPVQRWVQKETNKDLPPSYSKSISVSALNSFGNITIKSKNSTMDLSSRNQKRDLPPKMPSSQKLDPTPPDPMYEVSPGVQERLRGAMETWSYLQRDFYIPTSCKTCSVELTCIKNLDFVLCPTCQLITPIDALPEAGGGGLGLGFTVEDLRRWELGRNPASVTAYSA
jgi:hypothetical protein